MDGLEGFTAIETSAAASTVFRSTATATVASYAALLTICGGPLLVWLGRDAPFAHGTVETVLLADPLAAALAAAAMPGFRAYDLLPGNWWLIGSACLLLVLFVIVRTWQLTRPE